MAEAKVTTSTAATEAPKPVKAIKGTVPVTSSPASAARAARRKFLLRLRESYKVIYTDSSLRAIADMATVTSTRYRENAVSAS